MVYRWYSVGMQTRTIAYLRVSTDKQADHGVSLDAQRAKVEAYAGLYDLDLVDVAIDAGESAKSLNRPALAGALARLAAGEVDALLVVKLDRLTRSVVDLGTLVDRCNKQGWALLSVGEQIDTRTAAGRMVLNILATISQWEREIIGERTAAAMAYKASQGEYTGGEVPYGWTLAADGIHLEAHPEEQKALTLAGELRAAGLSLVKVGKRLSLAGYLPRNGRAWHHQTVKNMLSAKVAA